MGPDISTMPWSLRLNGRNIVDTCQCLYYILYSLTLLVGDLILKIGHGIHERFVQL